MTKKDFKEKMAVFLKGPAAGRTFDEILAIKDPSEFIRALVEFDARKPAWSAEEIQARPEPSRMVLLLDALHTCVSSGGIGAFLREPDAPIFFEDVLNYCAKIGANRAVEYLKSVAAYFPDGKIPKDEQQRWDILQALESSGVCQDFRKEDLKYRGVMDEMLVRFKQYVLLNRERFLQALGQRIS